MIVTGVYEPAAPGATHVAAATPLRDSQGRQVRVGVIAETRQATVWHDRVIRWAGKLPQNVITPADLFRWAQQANG